MGMVFCHSCGKEIADSAVTCPDCGAEQQVEANQYAPAQEPEADIHIAILIIGYVCTWIFPLAGLGVGIYALVKGKIGHGVAMIALTLLFVAVRVFV